MNINELYDNRINMDFHTEDELTELFIKVSRHMEAARRGLGIANRLRDPEDQRKHKSILMSNMNKIRKLLRDLDRAIAEYQSEME